MLKNVQAKLWISADWKHNLKMSVLKRWQATSVSAFKNLDSYK